MAETMSLLLGDLEMVPVAGTEDEGQDREAGKDRTAGSARVSTVASREEAPSSSGFSCKLCKCLRWLLEKHFSFPRTVSPLSSAPGGGGAPFSQRSYRA